MSKWIFAIALIMLQACSGFSIIEGPNGYRMVNLYDINSLAPTVQVTILEKCQNSECTPVNQEIGQQPGLVAGAFGSVLEAGSRIGQSMIQADTIKTLVRERQ